MKAFRHGIEHSARGQVAAEALASQAASKVVEVVGKEEVAVVSVLDGRAIH